MLSLKNLGRIIAAAISIGATPASSGSDLCGPLLGIESSKTSDSLTKKLENAKFRQFIHETSEHGLFQIAKSSTLRSAKAQFKAEGKAHKAWTGAADDKVFIAASPFEYNSKHFLDMDKGYIGWSHSTVKILLPLNTIERATFNHYSIGWAYGEYKPGLSFTSANFSDGLPQLVGNESNEFVFHDSIPIELDEIKIVVAPKNRKRIIDELFSVNPNIDWNSVVFEMIDPIPSPFSIKDEMFLELIRAHHALFDIYQINKQEGLRIGQYILLNQSKISSLRYQVINVATQILLDHSAIEAVRFFQKHDLNLDLLLFYVKDVLAGRSDVELFEVDRLKGEVEWLFANGDQRTRDLFYFVSSGSEKLDFYSAKVLGVEINKLDQEALSELIQNLNKVEYVDAIISVAQRDLHSAFVISKYFRLAQGKFAEDLLNRFAALKSTFQGSNLGETETVQIKFLEDQIAKNLTRLKSEN